MLLLIIGTPAAGEANGGVSFWDEWVGSSWDVWMGPSDTDVGDVDENSGDG